MALAAALAMTALLSLAARGHDHLGIHGREHDPLHHWYKTLRQPRTGYDCCDNKDCRPTTARLRNGSIEVMIDGEWTKVPPNTVLDVAPPDLRSHVCASKGPWSPKPVFCVVLGPGV
jgi:hypothetical protein